MLLRASPHAGVAEGANVLIPRLIRTAASLAGTGSPAARGTCVRRSFGTAFPLESGSGCRASAPRVAQARSHAHPPRASSARRALAVLAPEPRELGEESLGRGVPRVVPLFFASTAAHAAAAVVAGDPGGVGNSEHGLSWGWSCRWATGGREAVARNRWLQPVRGLVGLRADLLGFGVLEELPQGFVWRDASHPLRGDEFAAFEAADVVLERHARERLEAVSLVALLGSTVGHHGIIPRGPARRARRA